MYSIGYMNWPEEADTLSEEARIKSGAPSGSIDRATSTLVVCQRLPGVINVTALLFGVDVKTVSPRSQSDLLQRSLYNV